ncbi:hypothetical protein Scep_030333 [Stephania cephalantha]|uniref:Uncharacterized protein n=1 Tax=Stephania cephalantha TaxID=152367 RepID=A0AAP0HGE1_9MAGN
MVRDHTEIVQQILLRLKATQERHKSYYDLYHQIVEYSEGDWVYLKVSLAKAITDLD